MKDYVLLRNLINRARLLSIKNYGCPYVISHTGQTKKVGKTKDHICQVTPRNLITMMKKSRDSAGYASMENPPTFHTVRSLANSLAQKVKKWIVKLRVNTTVVRVVITNQPVKLISLSR